MRDEPDPSTLVAFGESMLDLGRAAEAEALFARALAARPGDPGALLGQVRAGLAARRFAGAVDALEALAAAHPFDLRHAPAQRMLALALYAEGYWEDAAPLLARAAALEPWDDALAAAAARTARPAYLAPEVEDPATGRRLLRYAARESGTYIYVIDIVGTCNLRCPTCPVGNSSHDGRPRGFMDRALFEAVVEKIARESPVPSPQVNLFNWGEPLLHPDLPHFLRVLRRAGMRSHLSSNLNIRRGLEEVVAAAPDDLKISLSGFSPETYGRAHLRGDLALVKRNMQELRRLLDRHRVATHVWVGHHIYRSNQHEAEAVRRFCADLGFAYHPFVAYYMPIERLMEVLDGQPNPRDRGILDDLLQHPAETQRAARERRSGRHDCELRFNQTVINHDGTVALCCTVYDAPNMLGVSFLDEDHAALEARRYAHPFCGPCMAANLHYAPRNLRPQVEAS